MDTLRFEQAQRRQQLSDEQFRKTRTLLEDMNAKLDLILQQVLANNRATEELHVYANRQFEELKSVNCISYVELERRWHEHERRIADLEAR